MRSLLFVPGNSPRKLEKSLVSGADVLIIDLEDSVELAAKAEARETARGFLRDARSIPGRPILYVRINPLSGDLADADLDAVMPGMPDGIMLPKAQSGQDVTHLGAKLAVREAEYDLADGATRIIAIATETPRAIFTLGTYAGASHRLAGLTWGAEDLSAAIGAERSRYEDGQFTSPYRLARDLTLFGASAADVAPIDTVFTNFRDEAGLAAECEDARQDGFTGKMAIHPAQVPIINAAFTPTPEALERAQAIVAAFEANPDAGVIGLDGEMLDRPHLIRARRIVDRAKED